MTGKDMAVKKKKREPKEEPKRRKEVLKDKVILIRATEAFDAVIARQGTGWPAGSGHQSLRHAGNGSSY